MSLLAASGNIGALAQGVVPEERALDEHKGGLHQIARSRGLNFGSCFSAFQIDSDPAYTGVLLADCGTIVPENDLKWALVHPEIDRFDFSRADRLIDFAEKNGLIMRGHPLLWHLQLPAWARALDDSRKAERVLTGHIEMVAGRYARSIHSWDVVNEAISPQDGQPDGLRRTVWFDLLGPGYIELAFRAAAAAAPNAELIYNDYSIELNNREHAKRRRHTLALLESLLSRGVPIHALGIQGHLPGDVSQFDANIFADFLKEVSDLGLGILITELDVNDQELPADPELRDRKIAEVYDVFLSTTLDNKAVSSVLTWGLSDRYSWLQQSKPRQDGVSLRPLPRDAELQRKPAWYAIAKAFSGISD